MSGQERERDSARAWFDGRWLAADAPAIPLTDRGFLLGDGLFETVRVWRGRPFRLESHLARLGRGADLLGMPVPRDLDSVARAVVDANQVGEGGLRITVSRGSGPPGLSPPDPPRPAVLVTAYPYRPDPRWIRDGLSVRVGRGRVAHSGLTSGLKGLGYAERIQAWKEARGQGADDALLRNGRGDLVGASAANLILVTGGAIRTPSPECGALAGITLGVVSEVAEELEMPVKRGPCPVPILTDAQEVVLTSSLRGVVPVVAVGERPVGRGRPGAVWKLLRDGYRSRLEKETRG